MNAPRRGRPRSEEAREAVLDAAADLLLEHGVTAVSMDEVAARAGVSKATIYRWWPTKETLALDALYHEWDTFRPSLPDTGSLRGDLLALVRPWVRRVRKRPYARVVAALVEETHTDPEFAELYHERFVNPRRDPARAVLKRAIERDQIPGDTNIELALDLLYGPLFHRLLHAHAPLSNRFVEDVVNATLAAIE
jgi:AcrR family transcriptional regulator